MSSNHALRATRPQPARRPSVARPGAPRAAASRPPRNAAETPLRVVPAAQPGPPLVRLVFACVVIAMAGLAGVLYIHTALAKDAYRLHDAERTAATLKAQEESLAHQVDSLNDPASIANKAAALGMVPGGSPVFVTPDGKSLGAALPKGTKVTYPSKLPANGMLIVGTPTPTASPNASAGPGPEGSVANLADSGSSSPSPGSSQVSPAPRTTNTTPSKPTR